jgi:hypothetical protein
MPNEKCVMCGKETDIDITTHVDLRTGYVDGLGQLCLTCYLKGTNREQMVVPAYLVNLYPNDQELGSKVRMIFHDIFDKK